MRYEMIEIVYTLIDVFLNPISIISAIIFSAIGVMICKFTNIKVYIFYFSICAILMLLGFCGRGSLYLLLMFIPVTTMLFIIMIVYCLIILFKKLKNKRNK